MKLTRYYCFMLIVLGVVSLSCENEDELFAPGNPTFSVDKTSGAASDSLFTFTINEVSANNIVFYPYGTQDAANNTGILIDPKTFVNGSVTQKIQYVKGGSFQAVVIANNRTLKGDVARVESTPITMTISAQPLATNKREAETYIEIDGVTNTGNALGQLDKGDYINSGSIDFGKDGVTGFTANIGVDNAFAGQELEIRIGSSSGKIIGTLIVQGTGGFGVFTEQSATIDDSVKGIQKVFFTFKGDNIGTLDWFKFTK
jgi:hypothetical protein